MPDGAFENLQGKTFDGVVDTAETDHACGLTRLNATTAHATALDLTSSVARSCRAKRSQGYRAPTRKRRSVNMGAMIVEADHHSPFNSALETGLRSVAILAEACPDEFDLERLLYFNDLVVHSSDADGPESLHRKNAAAEWRATRPTRRDRKGVAPLRQPRPNRTACERDRHFQWRVRSRRALPGMP